MENENGNVKSDNSSKSTINDSSTDQDIVNKTDPLKEDVTTSPRETMVKTIKQFIQILSNRTFKNCYLSNFETTITKLQIDYF
jgi:hypothetical protein